MSRGRVWSFFGIEQPLPTNISSVKVTKTFTDEIFVGKDCPVSKNPEPDPDPFSSSGHLQWHDHPISAPLHIAYLSMVVDYNEFKQNITN